MSSSSMPPPTPSASSGSTIPRIFVSHSHHDNAFCRPFVAHLRTRAGPSAGGVGTGGRPPDTAPPSLSAGPYADLVARLLPGIREAYEQENWHVVLDKAGYLTSEAPAASVPVEVYRVLGEARYETGDFAGARAILETALARDATDIVTLRLAGRACLHTANPSAAEGYLKKALALTDDATEWLALLTDYAEALIRLKQWPELVRRTDDALRLAPESAHWLDLRLQALLESGRDGDALVLLRTLTARPDAPARWWLERARLARQIREDDDEVRAALAGAEAIVPWNDPAVAQARRELLAPLAPPPPPELFPPRLASLGFFPQQAQDPKTGKPVDFIFPPTVSVPAGPLRMRFSHQEQLIEFTGMGFFRCRAGKIIEAWWNIEPLSLPR